MTFRRSLRVAGWTAAVFGILSFVAWFLSLMGEGKGEGGVMWHLPNIYLNVPLAAIAWLFDRGQPVLDIAWHLSFRYGISFISVPVNSVLGGVIGYSLTRLSKHEDVV